LSEVDIGKHYPWWSQMDFGGIWHREDDEDTRRDSSSAEKDIEGDKMASR